MSPGNLLENHTCWSLRHPGYTPGQFG